MTPWFTQKVRKNRAARRADKRKGRKRIRPTRLEHLETRQMLTTLFGGDVFNYGGGEIHLKGNIIAEVVGFDPATQAVGDLGGIFIGGTRLGVSVSGFSQLFNIYIAHAEEDASLVVVGYEGPFDGTIGTIGSLAAPDNIGTIYLGGRIAGNNPVTDATTTTSIGVRALGIDDLTNDPNNLSAGVTVSRTLITFVSGETNLDDRLMGQNLNQIVAMAVTNEGNAFVIDRDLLDVNGLTILGDQIASVDPTTGQAGTPVTVTDATGAPLTNLQGLAFGDLDLDGLGKLFTIVNTPDPIPSASLGALGSNNLPVKAFGVSPDGQTGFAVIEDSGVLQLWKISRSATTGLVTGFQLLGPIVDSLGSAITQVQSLDVDSSGKIYVAGFNSGAPLPNANVGGNLGGEYQVRALADQPGTNNFYAVNDNGQTYDLHRIQRNPDTNEVAGFAKLGTIRTSGGSVILNIRAIATDASGNIYTTGSSGDSIIPSQDVGSTLTGGGLGLDLNATDLAATTDGRFFAINNNAGVPELYFISRGADGKVNKVTKLGALTDAYGNAIRQASSLAVDPSDNKIYTAGFNIDAPIPTGSIGIALISGSTPLNAIGGGASSLILNAANIPDMTIRMRDGSVYGVDLSGATTLQQVMNRISAISSNLSVTINPQGTGLVITDSSTGTFNLLVQNGVDSNAATFLRIDNTSLGNTIRGGALNAAGLGDLNILALTVSSDGLTGYAINNKDGVLELYRLVRDPVTGTMTSFTRLGNINTASGQPITDLQTLDLDSNGQLFTIGFNGHSPAPTLSVGGNLNGNFNIQDLAITADNRIFAMDFNGAGFDLYSLTRDAATGRVSAFVKQGAITSNGAVITNLQALDVNPLDPNGPLITVGVDGNSVLPNVDVGSNLGLGGLGDKFSIVGLALSPELANDNNQRLFAVQATGSVLTLYEITRDADGRVSSFTQLGPTGGYLYQVVDRDTNGNPVTAQNVPVLGIRALDADPSTPATLLYTVAYNGTELSPEENIGFAGDSFNVTGVTVNRNDQLFFASRRDAISTDSGHEYYELKRSDRDPLSNAIKDTVNVSRIQGLDYAPAWAPLMDIVQIDAIEASPSDNLLYTVGQISNLPKLPESPIAGTLGDSFQITTLARTATTLNNAAGLDNLYAVNRNNTTFDLYRVRQTDTADPERITAFQRVGRINNTNNQPIFQVQAMSPDESDPTKLWVIGSGSPTATAPLSLYRIDVATGRATEEYPLNNNNAAVQGPVTGLASYINVASGAPYRQLIGVRDVPGGQQFFVVSLGVNGPIGTVHDVGEVITQRVTALAFQYGEIPPQPFLTVAEHPIQMTLYGLTGNVGQSNRTIVRINVDAIRISDDLAGVEEIEIANSAPVDSYLRGLTFSGITTLPAEHADTGNSPAQVAYAQPFSIRGDTTLPQNDQLWSWFYTAQLFSLDDTGGAASSVGNLVVDFNGDGVYEQLRAGNNSLAADHRIVALAIDAGNDIDSAEDDVFYAVIQQAGTGDHFLVTLDVNSPRVTLGSRQGLVVTIVNRAFDPVTGALVSSGRIEFGGTPARISEMDFTRTGELVAVDSAGGINKLIVINRQDPTQSARIADENILRALDVDNDPRGLGSSPLGRYFNIRDNSLYVNAAAPGNTLMGIAPKGGALGNSGGQIAGSLTGAGYLDNLRAFAISPQLNASGGADRMYAITGTGAPGLGSVDISSITHINRVNNAGRDAGLIGTSTTVPLQIPVYNALGNLVDLQPLANVNTLASDAGGILHGVGFNVSVPVVNGRVADRQNQIAWGDATALAVTPNGRVVYGTNGNTLYRINRTVNGNLADPDTTPYFGSDGFDPVGISGLIGVGANRPITGITAMEWDPNTNTILATGLDLSTSSFLRLMRIDPNTATATLADGILNTGDVATAGVDTQTLQLRNGLGIRTNGLAADMTIVIRSGLTFDIELSGELTLGGIAAAITTQTNGFVTVVINPGGGGSLTLTDTSSIAAISGVTPLSVLNNGGGSNVGAVNITRRDGVAFSFNLGGPNATVLDVLNAIGSIPFMSATIAQDNQIVVTDNTGAVGSLIISGAGADYMRITGNSGATNTVVGGVLTPLTGLFSVSNAPGSQAASDLGIAAVTASNTISGSSLNAVEGFLPERNSITAISLTTNSLDDPNDLILSVFVVPEAGLVASRNDLIATNVSDFSTASFATLVGSTLKTNFSPGAYNQFLGMDYSVGDDGIRGTADDFLLVLNEDTVEGRMMLKFDDPFNSTAYDQVTFSPSAPNNTVPGGNIRREISLDARSLNADDSGRFYSVGPNQLLISGDELMRFGNGLNNAGVYDDTRLGSVAVVGPVILGADEGPNEAIQGEAFYSDNGTTGNTVRHLTGLSFRSDGQLSGVAKHVSPYEFDLVTLDTLFHFTRSAEGDLQSSAIMPGGDSNYLSPPPAPFFGPRPILTEPLPPGIILVDPQQYVNHAFAELTSISAIQYTRTGSLMAYTNVTGTDQTMIELNLEQPFYSYNRANNDVNDNLVGMHADSRGIFYSVLDTGTSQTIWTGRPDEVYISQSNQALMTINPNAVNPNLVTTVGIITDTQSLVQRPVSYVFTGLAWTPDGAQLYAGVQDPLSSNSSRLLRITPSGAGAGVFTRVSDAAGLIRIGTNDVRIDGMDFSNDGQLVGIDRATNRMIYVNITDTSLSEYLSAPGSTADLDNLASGFNNRFYSINTADPVADQLWISTASLALFEIDQQTAEASPVGVLLVGNSTINSNHRVRGLAYTNDGTQLYGVLHNNATGIEQLLLINPATGQASSLGVILVDGQNPDIAAIEFTLGGDLVAYDDSQAGGRRMITLNLVTPGQSAQRTLPGSVDVRLGGLAADQRGHFYSINGMDAAADELWVSPSQLFRIDTTSAIATGIANVTANGFAVTDLFADIAFNAANTLFGVRQTASGDILTTISTVNGVLTTLGAIRVSGQQAKISGMDFTADGDLVAFDDSQALGRRMVVINTANPSSSLPRSAPGTVPATLKGFASAIGGGIPGISDSRFYSINDVGGETRNDDLWVSGNALFNLQLLDNNSDTVIDGVRAVTSTLLVNGGVAVTTPMTSLAIRQPFIVPEEDVQGTGLTVTGTSDVEALLEAILKGNGIGINVTNIQVNGQSNAQGAFSTGTYTNPGKVYGIRSGIILSSGDVGDYSNGPNNFTNNTTGYGADATPAQQTLLDPITDGNTAYDVTEVTITFDLLPGFSDVFFDIVWGSEEYPEYVGSPFIDGFGMFLNGVNIAQTAGGIPVNVDHPEMAAITGTELDGILTPQGNPVIRFGTTLGNAATNNVLKFIIADSGDDILDSTVYISSLGATPPPPTFYGVLTSPGGSQTLVTIDRDSTNSVAPVDDTGIVQLNGAATNIVALAFDPSNRLVAVNDPSSNAGDRHLIQIDVNDLAGTISITAPGSVSDRLSGLAGDPNNRFYSIYEGTSGSFDQLWISSNSQSLYTINSATGIATPLGVITSGSTVLSQSVTALAFQPGTGTLFGTVRAEGGDILVTINTTGAVGSYTTIGAVKVAGQGAVITAMDFDASGNLFAYDTSQGNTRLIQIGTTAGTVGLSTARSLAAESTNNFGGFTSDQNGRFFSVNNARSPGQLWVSAEQLFTLDSNQLGRATPVAPIVIDGIAEVHRVSGLAINLRNESEIYLVRDVKNTDRLARVNATTGVGTDLGAIFVDDENPATNDRTRITALDFNTFDKLLAIDNSQSGGRRLVAIDASNPANSLQLSPAGSIGAGFVGYASDDQGLFYSVNTASNPDELLVSRGVVSTLGTVNPVSGVFTSTARLYNVSLTDGLIKTIAFAPGVGSIPGQQGFYVIGGDGKLYEIDPVSGNVLTLGDEIRDSNGNRVEITSMSFDASGRLIGQDRNNGRLVDIDLTGLGSGTLIAGVNVATEVGALRPTVGAIAYNPATGELLAADNATAKKTATGYDPTGSASLMRVIGTESDSAVPQNITSILVDGAVTGKVNLSGAIDTFYGGWILTGLIEGQPIGHSLRPENFYVGGEMRNLISSATIGGDYANEAAENLPGYFTGTDISVQGRVGQVMVLGVPSLGDLRPVSGSFLAAIRVEGNQEAPVLGSAWRDIGLLPADLLTPNPVVTAFRDGRLNINKSFLQPQYLGSMSHYDGQSNLVVVDGYLDPPPRVNLSETVVEVDIPPVFNDTITTAQPISVSPGQTVSITGSVSTRDTVLDEDVYRIELEEGDTISSRIVIPNISELFASIAIYDAVGNLITTNRTAASNARTVEINATATYTGVFYVVVRAFKPPEAPDPYTSNDLFSGTSQGAYSLILSRQFPTVYPDYYAVPLMAGQTITVKLDQPAEVKMSSYIGGNLADSAKAVAVDKSGNIYVTGTTYSANWTERGYDQSYNGAGDAFVAKYSASGNLLWSTYLGGSGEDHGLGITIDPSGNVLVVGSTTSQGWATGGDDTAFGGGTDGFLAKLDNNGSLLWTGYLGGLGDEAATAVAVDSFGNAVVVGRTTSQGWIGGLDHTLGGGQDGFAIKFDASGRQVWSTYLGGDLDDAVNAVAFDANGNIYVAGTTSSDSWLAGGPRTTLSGESDGFLLRINHNGTQGWGTYVGGGQADGINAIAIDSFGDIYVAGDTSSPGWVGGGARTAFGGGTDGFVAKFDPKGGSQAARWSSYFGGSKLDVAYGLSIDAADNVFVTGQTASKGWIGVGFQQELAGGTDAFITKLDRQGGILHASYLGGDADESGQAVAVTAGGKAYVAGATSSDVFARDGYDRSYGGGGDGFIATIVEPGWLAVGIFDPDNTLVASNYSNVDRFTALSLPISLTADRPGIYRISIALRGDADFTTAGEFESGVPDTNSEPYDLDFDFGGYLISNPEELSTESLKQPSGLTPYRLTVSGLGEVGIGAIIVQQENILLFDNSIQVLRGDIGAVISGFAEPRQGSIGEFNATPTNYILSIGSPFQPNIIVDNGNLRSVYSSSIGLRSRVPTTNLNYRFTNGPTFSVINGGVGLVRTSGVEETHTLYFNPVPTLAPIGGDYQFIDASADFHGHLAAAGGIGVIRVRGTMGAPNEASSILINADGLGNDTIDLIDVGGDFGYSATGGPQISTGNGGNVRYIQVAGTVFQDRFFGSGVVPVVQHAPGSSVRIIDDSGAIITLTPVSERPQTDENNNPILDALTGRVVYIPGILSTKAYGIRGSGGSVLMEVTSTESLNVKVDGDGYGAEISRITLLGEGQSVIEQTVGNNTQYVLDPEGVPVGLKVTGSVPLDIFKIVAGNPISYIQNNTTGEIVNTVLITVGNLSTRGAMGLARSGTGAEIMQLELVGNVYPFFNQRTGIRINGEGQNEDAFVLDIRSGGALGNIFVAGTLLKLTANSDGDPINFASSFDGIAAPVYVTGDIGTVNIGHGITPSGSGNFARSGVFTESNISQVIGSISGADIRGDIVAGGSIGLIRLNGGSIINADIMANAVSRDTNGDAIVNLAISREFARYIPDSLKLPDFAVSGGIGAITLNGNGGIIGSYIYGTTIGDVSVRNGFGIINSRVKALGSEGTIGNVTAGGLGIRGTLFDGGGSQGNITVLGNGSVLDLYNYSSSVRLSESYAIDPYFGMGVSRITDLHYFLGTNIDNSASDLVTRSGMISDTIARGSRNLGTVSAWQIHDSAFNFANSIAGVKTTSLIDGLVITTGELKSFSPGADVFGLNMTVAGPINNVTIKGNLAGGSTITATGPNGDIKNVKVDGDLVGGIYATGKVGTITLGGNFLGDLVVRGNVQKGNALNKLTVGKDFLHNNFSVTGAIGSIAVNGNFGASDSAMFEAQSVSQLTVQGEFLTDAVIRGDVKTLRLSNGLVGDIFVFGSLGSFTGTGPIAGDVTVGGNVNSVSVNGNVAGTISSLFGNLAKITLTGDLAGGLLATRGAINSATISGAVTGSLAAQTAGALRIGSLASIGSITAGTLNSLAVTQALSGSVIVDRDARTLSAGSIERALIATGLGLQDVKVSGAISDSIIQTGIYRGADGSFTSGGSRNAGLGKLAAGSVVNSIISAGGDITAFTVPTVEHSTISAGWSIGGSGIDAYLAGNRDLSSEAARNNLRGRTDRALYRGDVLSFTGNLTNSQLTAGVDPGNSGSFANEADNNVLSSSTGGVSLVRTLRATLDSSSSVVTNSGIASGAVSGNTSRVTFTAETLAPNLPPSRGVASNGVPLEVAIGGQTLTITLQGVGSVEAYDNPATASVVDVLIVRGTDAKTRLTIAASDPNLLAIGRIVSDDDAALASLVYNGDVVGDTTAAPDLVIDGGVADLSIRGIGGSNWTGWLGGAAKNVSITSVGNAQLRVAGSVATATLGSTVNSNGSIIADSFGKVTLADGYSADLHSFVNGISTLTLAGAFSGAASTVGDVSTLTGVGSFSGTLSVGNNLTKASLADLTSSGAIYVGGNVNTFNQSGELAGRLDSRGLISKLALSGRLTGVINAAGNIGNATIGEFNGGLVVAGGDISSVTVTRNMVNGLITSGIDLGDDGIYNTADDRINGGSIASARINGVMRDSVFAAGVLPRATSTGGIPLDKRAYTGNLSAVTTPEFDNAEAGGIRTSRIDRLILSREVVSTNSASGRFSLVAAADSIGSVSQGGGIPIVQTVLNDPSDAPRVISTSIVRNSSGVATELRLLFSERVNTATLALGGTILVTDENGVAIPNVTLRYRIVTASDGSQQTELQLLRTAGFTQTTHVRLIGNVSTMSIYDRSGSRSILRNLPGGNVDPLGTVLDGDGDGNEGGDFLMIFDPALGVTLVPTA